MGDLLIRNISPTLKADIERLAARKGSTFTDAARDALRRGLDEMAGDKLKDQPAGQRLKRILGDSFRNDAEFQEFQAILEDIRKGNSRPLPDFE